MWYFVSLYLQQVLGYSPIEAGVAFLPMTAAIAFASTFAGRLSGRVGPGLVLTVGMTLIALGMAGFSFVDARRRLLSRRARAVRGHRDRARLLLRAGDDRRRWPASAARRPGSPPAW